MRHVVLVLVVAGCSGRTTGDPPPNDEPSAAQLEAHEEACTQWCNLLVRCETTTECPCEMDELDSPLCAEKTIANLECQGSLECDELPAVQVENAADQLCFGESVAQSAACYQ